MKKPKVVEFMGLPNAGKTTHIGKVARSLDAMGLDVRFIQDQIRDAPLKGDEIEKNLWAIRKTGNQIAEAKEQDWHLILVERGGWAYFASLKAHFKNGRQIRSKKKRRGARRAIRLALDLIHDEDFFILIEISPETALERDQQLGSVQPGKIINPAFLTVLNEAYQSVREKLPKNRRRIIDGQKDFEKNQEKILKTLLSLVGVEGTQNYREKKGEGGLS
jgi:thymidylate kinase